MKAEVSVSLNDYDLTRRSCQFYDLSILKADNDGPWLMTKTNDVIKKDSERPTKVEEGNLLMLDDDDKNDKEAANQTDCHIMVTSDENPLTDRRNYVTLVNIPPQKRDIESDHFSSERLVNQFTERLCVSTNPASPHKSCASFCHYEVTPPRCKVAVHLKPIVMTPVDFKESMIVLRDCTKKRYRSTINCWPRTKPTRFAETCYVHPKHLESTYVSYVDYNQDRLRVHYQSALQVTFRAFCNNFIESFEFQDSEGSTMDESEYEEDESQAGTTDDVSVHVNGDIRKDEGWMRV